MRKVGVVMVLVAVMLLAGGRSVGARGLYEEATYTITFDGSGYQWWQVWYPFQPGASVVAPSVVDGVMIQGERNGNFENPPGDTRPGTVGVEIWLPAGCVPNVDSVEYNYDWADASGGNIVRDQMHMIDGVYSSRTVSGFAGGTENTWHTGPAFGFPDVVIERVSIKLDVTVGVPFSAGLEGHLWWDNVVVRCSYAGAAPDPDIPPAGFGGVGGGSYWYPLVEEDRVFDTDGYPADYGGGQYNSIVFYGRNTGVPVLSPIDGFVESVDKSGPGTVVLTDADLELDSTWQVTILGFSEIGVYPGQEIAAGCLLGKLGLASGVSTHAGASGPRVEVVIAQKNPETGVYLPVDHEMLSWAEPPDPQECGSGACLNDGNWFSAGIVPNPYLEDASIQTYPPSPIGQMITVPEGGAPLVLRLRYLHGPLVVLIGDVWESSLQPWVNYDTLITLQVPEFPAGTYEIVVQPVEDVALSYPINQTFVSFLCVVAGGGASSRTCVNAPWYSDDPVEADYIGVYLKPGENAWLQREFMPGTWNVRYRVTSVGGMYGTSAQLLYEVEGASGTLTSGFHNLDFASINTNWETVDYEVSVPSQDTLKLHFTADPTNLQDVVVGSSVCYWLASEEALPPGVGSRPVDQDCDALLPQSGDTIFEALRAWISWLWCQLNNLLNDVAWWAENFWRIVAFVVRDSVAFKVRHQIRWRLMLEDVSRYEPFGTLRELITFGELVSAAWSDPDWSGAGLADNGATNFLQVWAANPPDLTFAEGWQEDQGIFAGVENTVPDFGTLGPYLGMLAQPMAVLFEIADRLGLLGWIRIGFNVSIVVSFIWYVRRRWISVN